MNDTQPDPQQKSWWESLTPGHRAVIVWFNSNIVDNADERSRLLSSFCRSVLEMDQTPNGDRQHELAHQNFAAFVAYCRGWQNAMKRVQKTRL